MAKTHGKYGTRFYTVWRCMMARCHDPKHKSYKQYGAKGVKVCKKWRDVATFIRWCEKHNPPIGHRLERVELRKGYSPKNCTWITNHEQQKNKSNNVVCLYKNKKYIFIDLVKEVGAITPSLGYSRLARGWEPIKAATTPPIRRSNEHTNCR